MSSSYNVVAKKAGRGVYTLSYGRGSKKLTTTARKQGPGAAWEVTVGTRGHMVGTLKDAKEKFGSWARETYASNGRTAAKQASQEDQADSPGPEEAPEDTETPAEISPVWDEDFTEPGLPDNVVSPVDALADMVNWAYRQRAETNIIVMTARSVLLREGRDVDKPLLEEVLRRYRNSGKPAPMLLPPNRKSAA